jgi:hypothetical protein
MRTVFLRVLEAEDKALALLDAIRTPNPGEVLRRFEVETSSFSAVPGSPFAYWISEPLRRLFKNLPAFGTEERTPKVGLQTADDFRFVRTWWEVDSGSVGRRWFPFAKGGAFSPFYGDTFLMVNWEMDGQEMKAWTVVVYGGGHWSRNIRNPNFYFRSGLTWSSRTQQFGPRALPRGCIFAHKGPTAFVGGDDENELLSLLGMMNSRPFAALVETRLNAADATARSYEVGVIEETPIPSLTPEDTELLAEYAGKSWSLRQSLDTKTEVSHGFTIPALLQVRGTSLAASVEAWSGRVHIVEDQIDKIQSLIDDRCFDLYAISEADRLAIIKGFAGGPKRAESSSNSAELVEPSSLDTDDEIESYENSAPSDLVADLLMWAVGVSFGRFDIRLATKGLASTEIPKPFDPLPICSPAMLTDEEGHPVKKAPKEYPIAFPENGILVDDPGHVADFGSAVRSVFDIVFGHESENWWADAEAVLGVKSQGLRNWFSSNCFDQYLKRYSKSRRKAPVVWQIALPSVRYSVWLYAPRLSRETFLQIQNDVVTPKLTLEESHLLTLRQESEANTSAKLLKELELQEALVSELRDFVAEIARSAALWFPSIDDGVVLAMAPLWRLVPQHKLWQKELKSRWHEMVSGKHDWSRIAMHLWPERVVPKCAVDRSLAIAHGLEENFWFEDEDEKWQPFENPKRSIDALVRERTSVSVKAALKSLLEASDAIGGGKRTRRSRAA